MALKQSFLAEVFGEIVAVDVPLDVYMAQYAEQHCEWIDGVVIRVSPSEIKHNKLIHYLYMLLDAYFELTSLGTVIGQPFVMRLPEFPKRRREPDLLVVLNSNPNDLKTTYLDGAADICIEVVSEESTVRDHGEKFREYEKGGVGEYWIIDYHRQECHFYRLTTERIYQRQAQSTDGTYQTPLLPRFVLDASTLLQTDLPQPIAVAKAVQAMLTDNSGSRE